jgi:hypothetical protein
MNRQELSDALDSLVEQHYCNLEVVIVDAEGTGAVEISSWDGLLNLNIVTTGAQLARSAAANWGLRQARGDYVIFLDDDDWFLPDHIQTLLAAIEHRPGVRAVYSGVECRRQLDNGHWEFLKTFNEPFDATRLLFENYIPIHAVLFERKLTEEGIVFDEKFDVFEDWDFWLQLSSLTEFAHVDQVTAVYRIADTSGFGFQDREGRAQRGLEALLEKWRHRWTRQQLSSIAGYPRAQVDRVLEKTRIKLAAQSERIAILESQLAATKAELEQRGSRSIPNSQQGVNERNGRDPEEVGLGAVDPPAAIWSNASMPQAVAMVSEPECQALLTQIRGILHTGSWQFVSPLLRVEQRFPRLWRTLRRTLALVWWSLRLKIPLQLQLRAQVRQVIASGLFDEDWYLRQYPNVIATGAEPLIHWLTVGHTQGYQPSPLFDCTWYLRHNPDASKAGSNPISHYYNQCYSEGSDPHPLFDSAWYLQQVGDSIPDETTPLGHYMEQGCLEGLSPHPLFDPCWYSKQLQDGAVYCENPLKHYITVGVQLGLNPHPLFDTHWYMSENPHPSDMNPLIHYLTTGAAEGRDPHPLFDTSFYLESYWDALDVGTNPLLDYVVQGFRLGRDPCPSFCTNWYLSHYPEALDINPLIHYLTSGPTERK